MKKQNIILDDIVIISDIKRLNFNLTCNFDKKILVNKNNNEELPKGVPNRKSLKTPNKKVCTKLN